MQLTTTNRLLSAALVAGALFSAPAQAQSSAVTPYKLLVDSTLVLGETTGDGLFTLKKVECLGSCDTAPVMQVNEKYHENLDVEDLDELLETLRG